MKIGNRRCQCTVCGLYFNSVPAFDKHRTGAHANNTRRCRDAQEMREIGMTTNAGGYWIGSTRPRAA